MKRKKEIVLAFFILIIFICTSELVLAMRARSLSICRVPVVNGVCCEQYFSCMQFDWGACLGGMPIEGFDCGCYYADINNDGKVDIIDIAIVAVAFGSRPGSINWNPNADLDGNDQINIIDISMAAKEFGKSC